MISVNEAQELHMSIGVALLAPDLRTEDRAALVRALEIAAVVVSDALSDGTSGQDRKSYTDTQDRDSYTAQCLGCGGDEEDVNDEQMCGSCVRLDAYIDQYGPREYRP